MQGMAKRGLLEQLRYALQPQSGAGELRTKCGCQISAMRRSRSLRGEKDGWIAPADLKTMAAAMPDCRLITVPGIGPSMNLESPALYAGYFGVLVRWAAGT